MPNLTVTFLAAILAMNLPLEARIVRIVIEQRESPASNGESFGNAGLYEVLRGRAYGEVDPNDRLNAIITDIRLAPRNARGKVEYVATFALARPIDMSKASGVLMYEVPNRGNGNPVGWNEGHISLVSGWQGDISPRAGLQTVTVPTAKNLDGSSVTGPVLYRFSNMQPNANTLAIMGGIGAGVPGPPPASLDSRQARLTRQASEGSAAILIPSADWAFADCHSAPFPGTPDPGGICLKGGFDPAYLYQLTYTAKDPLVLGLGFAATRDIVPFFRRAARDDSGSPNPVAGRISFVIGRGTSQSGNFVKTFIHLGFNQDECGRIVWDGANAHIAGRLVPLNVRFGIPGGASNLYEAGSEGVLWWGDYTDSARQRPAASLLDRCRATGTCPKVFETFGSTEFWGLRMSPGLVGNDAKADIPLPPNVRRYYFPGVTHNGGQGGFSTAGRSGGSCLLPGNPNPVADTMRALTVALVDWVANGTPPPPSRYPTLGQGQLAQATQGAMGFPSIPGAPLPDSLVNSVLDYDFGPGFRYNDVSGVISIQPPIVKQVIPTLVPKVDADGNEIGGVPSALHQAPLGTYLGWNVTAGGYFKGRICGFSGGYIPFAKSKAERTASGDPRLSIEERYGTHEKYIEAVRAAAGDVLAGK
jgi:hypothetical protein